MKKGLAKIVVALSLSLTSISGCSLLPSGGRSSSRKSSNNDNPSSLSTSSYESSVDVSVISNKPVSQYNQATLAKLRKAFDYIYLVENAPEGNYEQAFKCFTDDLLAMRIGNELASYFADWFVEMMDVSQALVNNVNAPTSKDSYYGKIVNCVYKGLTVLKSVDANQYGNLVNLCTKYMSLYSSRRNDYYYGYSTYENVYDYANVRIFDISYRTYKDIRAINERAYDGTLSEFISDYEQYLSEYYISDSTLENYNNYRNRVDEFSSDSYYSLPALVMDFFSNHGETIKKVLTDDVKVLLDTYGRLVEQTFEDLIPSLYAYYDGATTDVGYVLYEIFKNREQLLSVSKTLLTNDDLYNLFIRVFVEIELAELKRVYSNDYEYRSKVDDLEHQLDTIDGSHFSALANFAITFLKKVSSEDYASLVKDSFGFDRKQFYSYLKKYAVSLTDTINEFNANDKAKITELSSVFGFDFFDELQQIITILNTTNMDNDRSIESMEDRLSNLFENLKNEISQTNFADVCRGGDNGSTVSKPYPYRDYGVSFNSTIYQHDTNINRSDIWLHLYVYDKGISFETSLDQESINNAIEYRISEARESMEYDDYAREQYEFFSTLSLSFVDFTIDTSMIGYIPFTLTININGEIVEINSTTYVSPRGGNKFYFNIGASASATRVYSREGSFQLLLAYRYDDLVVYSPNDGSTYELDTSRLGWNVYCMRDDYDSSRYYCCLYYVISNSDSLVMGGHSDFPFAYVCYKNVSDSGNYNITSNSSYLDIDGIYFYADLYSYDVYQSISSQLKGLPAGVQFIEYGIISIRCLVVDAANLEYIRYEGFDLYNLIDEMVRYNLTTKQSASVVASIRGLCIINYEGKEYSLNAYASKTITINDIALENRHLSFRVDNDVYHCFVYSDFYY